MKKKIRTAKKTMLRTGEIAHQTVIGHSNQGLVEYALISSDANVRAFLAEFLANSTDLDSQDPSHIRNFIRYISTYLEKGFSLPFSFDESFLWGMVLHLRHCAISKNECKMVTAMGFYLFRYVISSFPQYDIFPEKLLMREAIFGKELITFALQEYTGKEEVCLSRSTGKKYSRVLILGLRFENPVIQRLYKEFFMDGFPDVRGKEFNLCHKDFEKSFGPYATSIHSVNDLSANIFWYQIKQYYLPLYRAKKAKLKRIAAIHHVIDFYRYITATADGCHIFDNSSNLSAIILRRKSFINYIFEDRVFIPISECPEKPTMGKAVIVFKNCGDINTRICEDECVLIDFSLITSLEYREIAWRYVFRDYKSAASSGSGYIAKALEILYQRKLKTGAELKVLKATEAREIRFTFIGSKLSEKTLAASLNSIKRFFDWAKNAGYFDRIEPLALSFFRFKLTVQPNINKVKAIPEEDANAILKYFADRASDSFNMKLCYCITQLLTTTQFRISQICQMDIRKISLTDNEKGGLIAGISKVNTDDKVKSVTSVETVRFLQAVIRESEELRENCYDKSIRYRLFLYKGSTGYNRFTDESYKEELSRACRVLNLRPWSPYNFRHMFATYSDDNDYRHGGDGTKAAFVMNHKSFKTTHDNYIDHTYETFKATEKAFDIGTEEELKKSLEELKSRNIDK